VNETPAVSVQASHHAEVPEKLPHEHGASYCPHSKPRRGVLRDCCSKLYLEAVTCPASDLPPEPLLSAFSFLIRKTRAQIRSNQLCNKATIVLVVYYQCLVTATCTAQVWKIVSHYSRPFVPQSYLLNCHNVHLLRAVEL
jgi:hypothetical protein